MSSPEPRISIVVPVYNCVSTIGRCLDSLFALHHSSYEVIIVDDGSTDGTAEVCESRSGTQVIRLDRGGPSRARNEGIARARGKFVAFTDGDCIVDREWLNELEKGFLSAEIAGVGGDQQSPEDDTRIGKTIHGFFKSIGFMTQYIKTGTTLRQTDHNPSCNSAYRRSVLLEVGGFDPDLFPGEDVKLDLHIRRKGYTLMFNPAARVAHYRAQSYGRFAKMMRRYGAGEWHLFRQFGLYRKIDYVPVTVIVGMLAFSLVLIWESRVLLALLIPLPASFLWFFYRTKEFRKSIQYTALLVLTVVNWNWGFFTGCRYRPVLRT